MYFLIPVNESRGKRNWRAWKRRTRFKLTLLHGYSLSSSCLCPPRPAQRKTNIKNVPKGVVLENLGKAALPEWIEGCRRRSGNPCRGSVTDWCRGWWTETSVLREICVSTLRNTIDAEDREYDWRKGMKKRRGEGRDDEPRYSDYTFWIASHLAQIGRADSLSAMTWTIPPSLLNDCAVSDTFFILFLPLIACVT